MKMIENARYGQARNIAGFLKAREFGLFEGGKNCMVVKKSDGRIAAEFGEAEDAHYAKLTMRMRGRVAERR